MSICEVVLTPINWWWSLHSEVKAAWLQAVGAIIAIWLTQRIASNASRDALRREESDRLHKSAGAMMDLLVAVQRIKIGMQSAEVALKFIPESASIGDLKSRASAIAVDIPHSLIHALRDAHLFNPNVRNVLFKGAQKVVMYKEYADSAVAFVERQSAGQLHGIVAKFNPTVTPTTIFSVAKELHGLAGPDLDTLEKELQAEISVVTGAAFEKKIKPTEP